jgi:hypothetical protein
LQDEQERLLQFQFLQQHNEWLKFKPYHQDRMA